MDDKLTRDLDKSAKAFIEIGWPRLKPIIGGKIIQIETLDGALATKLDMNAGVDAWHENDNGDMTSCAVRMQEMDFHTFTVRYKRMGGSETEWPKRRKWLAGGQRTLGPTWTIQGYYQAKQLLRIGLIDTATLFNYMAPFEEDAVKFRMWEDGEGDTVSAPCRRPKCYLQRVGYSGTGNWFFVCDWSYLPTIKTWDLVEEQQKQEMRRLEQETKKIGLFTK